MANIIKGIRSAAGEVLGAINDFTSDDTLSAILTSEANKAWRAKILYDRKTRIGPKQSDNWDKPGSWSSNQDYSVHGIDNTESKSTLKDIGGIAKISSKDPSKNRIDRAHVESVRNSLEVTFGDGTIPVDEALKFRDKHHKLAGNSIIIYNISDSSNLQYIELQTVPKEIDFQGESAWAVIHSMGRNTPMYHFTGAESVIQMNISWYCNDRENPQEVVSKCRLLEAWSKANGYLSSPPVLEIQWGSSDLFKDQKFILTAATYKLSNWRADARIKDKNSKAWVYPEGYENPKMYPATATQELIFRRVSATNLTYEEIIRKEWLEKTSGIVV